jgi:hypothetical protein
MLAPHITITEISEATYAGRDEFYSGLQKGDRVELRRETTFYNTSEGRKSSSHLSARSLHFKGASLSIGFGDITDVSPAVWRLKSVTELVEFGVSRDVTLAYVSGLEAGKRAGIDVRDEQCSAQYAEAICFAGAEEHGDRAPTYVEAFGNGFRESLAKEVVAS